MDKVLEQGYLDSAALTKEHAKTFYFCSHLLNKEKRMAAYSVYALSRLIDDSFDSPQNDVKKELTRWRDTVDRIYGSHKLDEPVFAALRHTVKKYQIPDTYFKDLLLGMEMDINKSEYSDFSELYLYCYRVAGVIGLILLKIFGYSDEKALYHAEKMGVAMQLTNILRDIKEDLGLGRLYLPLDELEEYNISRHALECGQADENFKSFMKFQVKRARSYYNEGRSGLNLIVDGNSRFIAGLMGTIYSDILHYIELNDYDVFTKRNYVPPLKKVYLLLKTLLNRTGLK